MFWGNDRYPKKAKMVILQQNVIILCDVICVILLWGNEENDFYCLTGIAFMVQFLWIISQLCGKIKEQR